MEHYTAIYAVGGGLIALLVLFKSLDWLIGMKYKTKDECNTCRQKLENALDDKITKLGESIRSEIKDLSDRVNKDSDLLSRLDAKIDMIIQHNSAFFEIIRGKNDPKL